MKSQMQQSPHWAGFEGVLFGGPGPIELVGDVLVIIGLDVPLWLKAYTGAYMLLVAVPCQARKMPREECSYGHNLKSHSCWVIALT